jgi:plasmid stabilization system protein ParE
MPPLLVHPAARDELIEGFEWFESRIPGLGHAFLGTVREAFTMLRRMPSAGAVAFEDIRRMPLPRFPYVIYYVAEGRQILVLAVIHGRRHPLRWKLRR